MSLARRVWRRIARGGRPEALDPTWARIVHGVSPGDLRVQAGPFAGMRYLSYAGSSGLLPKIIGCYEFELWEAVEESIARRPARLINIGSAEGYYAVGYALRLPRIEVHTFDVDARARRRLAHLARYNAIDRRVQSHSRCTHDHLQKLIVPASLIVCDCEGCEAHLLDLQQVPALRTADLLVELHVERVPDVAAIMRGRFSGTHAATHLVMVGRDPENLGAQVADLVGALAPEDRGMALFERNERTEWLWLRSAEWLGLLPAGVNTGDANDQ
jgi:hypothetical protein